ncbi:MBL fold metallo-hydrolase [Desulfurobacterium atlanticum]|uniref:Ribonuclease BN, tRNA processing enzyme n=1 Tax=Desulfurobacterium atlanticum TaxID=240169 RepID=A0A238YC39_9BACT|nr:MBL fold metallo-hydrolase [Desulfurobacterium atlanticum]SNR68805.1 Ribonuclease BN, tRNA processing enzyme [Desulfurobacterium atlanticum]
MILSRETVKNRIVFLGTAGARYAAFGLIRQAGGIWIDVEGTNIHIDPGPGALIYSHKKGLNPHWLSYLIISHRHLDHCADINHMIEAITLGGKRKKGILLCPEDAVSEDPVVLEYTRNNLEKTIIIKEGLEIPFESGKIKFPIKHIHGVDTFGVVVENSKKNISIGYIADTKYFDKLIDAYKTSNILIINTTLKNPKPLIPHLSVPDAEKLIKEIKPELAILTHFGRTMVSNKPWEIAKELSEKTDINTIAAWDNMIVDTENFKIVRQK